MNPELDKQALKGQRSRQAFGSGGRMLWPNSAEASWSLGLRASAIRVHSLRMGDDAD